MRKLRTAQLYGRKVCGAMALVIVFSLFSNGALWAQEGDNAKTNNPPPPQFDKILDSSGQGFNFAIKILIKYIFPLLALSCSLFGVARGMRQGQWDFAVICIIASIVLAVLPKVLSKMFGFDI